MQNTNLLHLAQQRFTGNYFWQIMSATFICGFEIQNIFLAQRLPLQSELHRGLKALRGKTSVIGCNWSKSPLRQSF